MKTFKKGLPMHTLARCRFQRCYDTLNGGRMHSGGAQKSAQRSQPAQS